MTPAQLSDIERAVARAEGGTFRITDVQPVGGGCISPSFRVGDGRRRFFVKVGQGAGERFDAEADGLQALARCDALAVPRVIARGRSDPLDFLVLEWLDLDADGDEARLGAALAALHGITYARFGWARDNFIGATPQENAWEDDWATFFRERRLLPQLRRAAERGAPRLLDLAKPVIDRLEERFEGYAPVPALVHGDLWSGNKGFAGGRHCVFDPAVHAGDGETDLAMSELFGGFSPAFYEGYRAVRSIHRDYPSRRPLYQLYHVLNHFNLFGGIYARQAERLIERLRTGGPA